LSGYIDLKNNLILVAIMNFLFFLQNTQRREYHTHREIVTYIIEMSNQQKNYNQTKRG